MEGGQPRPLHREEVRGVLKKPETTSKDPAPGAQLLVRSLPFEHPPATPQGYNLQDGSFVVKREMRGGEVGCCTDGSFSALHRGCGLHMEGRSYRALIQALAQTQGGERCRRANKSKALHGVCFSQNRMDAIASRSKLL